MKCNVCNSEKEVLQFDRLYTSGSEGTKLCLDCRIAVCEMIRRMKDVCGRKIINTGR